MREFAFVNSTGSTIPAGAALRPTGVNAAGFTTVAQANADSSMYVIFNAPVDVANGAYGVAFGWDSGVVPVAVDPADEPYTSADTFGTKSGDWRLRKGFKGFRLPTASVQGIANAVPDPAGGTATLANWSASVAGILTTDAQTGAGLKQTGTGTDGVLPGWYTVVTPAEMTAATGSPTSWVGFQSQITTVSGTGTSVFSTAFRRESYSPSPLGVTQNWVSLILSNQTNGSAAVSIFHGAAGAGWVCSGIPGGSNTNGFAVVQGGTLYTGATATVSGLSFRGGLYISGSLSVSAGSVTGLATVATSGSYADLTNKPTSPGWARCSATGGTLSVLNSSGCSVTRNGVGDFTFSFADAPLSSGDWTATFAGSEQSGQSAVAGIKSFAFNSVRVQFRLTDGSGTAVDPDYFTAVGVW